jgi:Flp pilus assembly protein TadD
MSRAKSTMLFAALSVIASTSACATAPGKEAATERDSKKAIAAAMKPASAEEVAAANRADPLTKANFWAREHAKDPENLDKALTFARALRGIGSDQRAVDVLSQVLVVHPDSVELYMILGRALAKSGAPAPAVSAFSRAAELEPKRAEAWGALGTALDKIDRHKEAQAAYTKALEIDPTRTVTLTNYGLSLALAGDLAGAEGKLRTAAMHPDAGPAVTENLALVLGLQGRFEEMRALTSANASPAIADANAKALEAMVDPNRSWDRLMEKSEAPAATGLRRDMP